MFVACLPNMVLAQEEAAPVAIDIQKPDIAPVEPYPQGYRSLFFTAGEHARLITSYARHTPNAAPVATPVPALPDETAPLPEAQDGETIQRVLHLSGIVYANPQDWSIWLNGQQITPKSQPDEVRGLRVARDYIELQWYDVINKAVVPVRLRPQQRFSLDTHSFVPAIGEAVPVTPPPAPPVEPTATETETPAEDPIIIDEEEDEDWDDWEEDEALLWDLLESDLP